MDHDTQKIAWLDRVYAQRGSAACAAAFETACREDLQKGGALLREPGLTYPCFHALLPAIKANSLLDTLSPRSITAAEVTDYLLTPEAERGPNPLKEKRDNVQDALRWMVAAGPSPEGSGHLRMVQDGAAAVLLCRYRDREALPKVCDMIMRREEQGQNTHYLVWAYFSTRDPKALRLMAAYLTVGSPAQRSLAGSLLGQEREEQFRRWLDENDAFLYFTGESLQYSGRPSVCSIDLVRKYLNRGGGSYFRTPLVPTDNREAQALSDFNRCSPEEQNALSRRSYQIYRKDPALWNIWINQPIDNQLKDAATGKEGQK